MGLTNSPLEGRVVFVIGVARSGTTWLARLMTRHPEFVGAGESHLFDWGVDALFDNLETSDPQRRFLASYVDRREMVGLVRELCDGLFLRMREKRQPDARFIVEKTPFSTPSWRTGFERKLECYPEAWYIHLIRDPRAIVRSWHERWGDAWTATKIGELWAEAIGHVRSQLGDSPRFREVRYADLLDAPVEMMGELFQWLGADRDEKIDSIISQTAGHSAEPRAARDTETWELELSAADVQAVEQVARTQMLEEGFALRRPAVPPLQRMRAHAPDRVPQVARRLARGAARIRRSGAAAPRRLRDEGGPTADLCTTFAHALSEGDEAALRALVSPELRVELRTGAGDHSAKGEQAIRSLRAAAQLLFGNSTVAARWVPSAAQPVASLWFTGTRADARRVDAALAFTVDNGRIARVFLLCLDPGGLQPSSWEPQYPARAG